MYECTSTVKIKANSAFSLLNVFRAKATHTPISLAGISITAHIKNPLADQINHFVPKVIDEANGLFRLSLPDGSNSLPVGTWYTVAKPVLDELAQIYQTALTM